MRGMWMTKSPTNVKRWGPPKSTHGMGLDRLMCKTCGFLLKFQKKLMRRKIEDQIKNMTKIEDHKINK